MSENDVDALRRYKILPITWLPTGSIVAVADDIGFAEASRLGLPIVGRINVSDFRNAFRYRFARSLVNTTTHHLRRAFPEFSASSRLTPAQGFWACASVIAIIMFTAYAGAGLMLLALSCVSALFFSTVIGLRIFCLLPQEQHPPHLTARSTAIELPVYTVLVPLFRETRVLNQLVGALSVLNYPPHLLDIKLILEETDAEMQHAVSALRLPGHFDVVIVPAGFPQTKPRALNYALKFARGSLVTIFDSEDIPEPNQLMKAAQRFATADEDVACLQARLRFFNPAENWLAGQFSAEYATLFEVILPALAAQGLPLLLGGTSNHFRISALQQIGGWDPFNVTEDADLGIRMARLGYKAEALDSTTFEEANTHVGNWLKQRRRWLKGFLQTWLVHNRNPIETLRALGFSGFVTMQCMTLGVFASALLHPILVLFGISCLLPAHISLIQNNWLQMTLAGINLLLLISGYATAMIAMRLAMRRAGLFSWAKLALSLPAYWCLLSIAAWQAVFDFVFAPFHWHKTEHGLTTLTRPTGNRRRRPR